MIEKAYPGMRSLNKIGKGDYCKLSAQAASKVLRAHLTGYFLPRPGNEIVLAMSTPIQGTRVIANTAGQYEYRHYSN